MESIGNMESVPWTRLYDKRLREMCIKNPCQNLRRKKKKINYYFFSIFVLELDINDMIFILFDFITIIIFLNRSMAA